MDRNRDIAKIKKVIHNGLRALTPDVYIEQRSITGHLEVFVISDGFEPMELWDRDTLVWDVLEKALITDPVYRTIAGVFPYTPAEFAESFGPTTAVGGHKAPSRQPLIAQSSPMGSQ